MNLFFPPRIVKIGNAGSCLTSCMAWYVLYGERHEQKGERDSSTVRTVAHEGNCRLQECRKSPMNEAAHAGPKYVIVYIKRPQICHRIRQNERTDRREREKQITDEALNSSHARASSNRKHSVARGFQRQCWKHAISCTPLALWSARNSAAIHAVKRRRSTRLTSACRQNIALADAPTTLGRLLNSSDKSRFETRKQSIEQ